MGTTIYLTGEVGTEVTLASVKAQVEANPVPPYTFDINSPGGNVQEGEAIYDYIKSLEGTTTRALKDCSSIATVIHQAGDERIIVKGVSERYMIHDVNVDTSQLKDRLTGDEMAILSVIMKEEEDKLSGFYAENTKLTFEQADELMRLETNLTPEQALGLGFATKIENKVMDTSIKNLLAKIAAFGGDGGAKNMTVSGMDGKTFALGGVDVAASVGKAVTNEGESISDGSYALTNNQTMAIANGVLTGITAVVEGEESRDPEEMQELKAQVSGLESSVKGLTKAVSELIEGKAVEALVAEKTAAAEAKLAATEKDLQEALTTLKNVTQHLEIPGDGGGRGDETPEKTAEQAFVEKFKIKD